MTWGIIGALDKEVALIREKMQVHKTVELYGSSYSIGKIGSQDVVVVCCSVGTINGAACAAAVIREFGADVVVNIGISGSLCKELKILDVVVSDHVLFHDADRDILEKYYPFRRQFTADEKLVALCTEVLDCMPDRSFAYKVGRIATGDMFVNDKKAKERIVAKFSPLCVEMEGAAIGQVAMMNATPFLVIRTLSDNADDDADEAYDNFLELAAHNSATIVLAMINRYAG